MKFYISQTGGAEIRFCR